MQSFTSSATPFRSKMRATEPGPASASGSILYRSGMSKKVMAGLLAG